jgi:hypothetical protein
MFYPDERAALALRLKPEPTMSKNGAKQKRGSGWNVEKPRVVWVFAAASLQNVDG